MKNNRLTNEELGKLRMACERIRKLASLENASFEHDKEKDKEIKQAIKHYMIWFKITADSIDDLLDGKNPDYLHFR